jgi:hypothetical protein
MPGIDEAQMQRLENETGRLTNDIKQKEEENEVLRGQIASLRCQIEQSNKVLEEVTQVRTRHQILHGSNALRPMRRGTANKHVSWFGHILGTTNRQ